MNRIFLPAALLLAMVLAPLFRLPAVGQEPVMEVNWRTDYAAARKEANAAKKPLFVVFRCER
jgi:hypothetical protein